MSWARYQRGASRASFFDLPSQQVLMNTQVGALTVSILAFAWYRRKLAQSDAKNVRELVRTAIRRLREQARNRDSDSMTATRPPYLVSVRLRDELLLHEPALAERQRIWKMVERVVVSNANVRASLEETADGDEALAWTWIGSLRS